MGRLVVDGDELVLELSDVERLEGFHDAIRVPLSSVWDVRATDDPWGQLRGVRAPGTGVPGVIAVATRRGKGRRDFAVVHGIGRAAVVDLEDASSRRLVVTEGDADAAVATLREAAGIG